MTQAARAISERFEAYRPYLTLLATVHVGRRLRTKVDPEDLVQETFLAAVSTTAKFRGTDGIELAAWLRRVLASRILKTVRRFYGAEARDVRRELAHLHATPSDSTPDALSGLLADLSTPSGTAQRRERAAIVTATLAALPPDYRDVLVLRNLEGLSFPEVAEFLGRSVGAVTMLWTRAVRQFRLAYPEES
jgi:RNA polymerase sigma-70 factor (ECF subfamily)